MKREILFRGKTKTVTSNYGPKEFWVYGSLVIKEENNAEVNFVSNNNIIKTFYIKEIKGDWQRYTNDFYRDAWKTVQKEYVVAPETIGQFTGLTDKNGKKIFEGDIVKTKYGRLCRVVRVFLPSYVGWDLEVFDENNALTTKKPDEYDLYYKDNLEVIGNIFDKESDNGD